MRYNAPAIPELASTARPVTAVRDWLVAATDAGTGNNVDRLQH